MFKPFTLALLAIFHRIGKCGLESLTCSRSQKSKLWKSAAMSTLDPYSKNFRKRRIRYSVNLNLQLCLHSSLLHLSLPGLYTGFLLSLTDGFLDRTLTSPNVYHILSLKKFLQNFWLVLNKLRPYPIRPIKYGQWVEYCKKMEAQSEAIWFEWRKK